MRMKLIWCTIWVLSALLIAASLDATPDPPAVDPLKMVVKVPGPAEHVGGLARERSSLHVMALPAPFGVVGNIISQEPESHRQGDVIVQAGFAADPSPPAAGA